ncbi:MAG: ferrous iron transport protein B [Christensenellaceae bacterium]|jgi:ferrous iron transport protein B|nr:ferrous iron transport protein B [Christensenellaceae bacterium]
MSSIALIGNPNAGKTTLFNALTGSNQHVGNFPGVTVEKKEGLIRGRREMNLVDLPGIYSLSPYSAEEVVTRDFLIEEKPQAVIDIVDATNIERNLYLTVQLMELGAPVVVALNMMDEVRANGDVIDAAMLSKELGLPVVPISASLGEGLEELMAQVEALAARNAPSQALDLCEGPVHTAVHSIAHIVEAAARRHGMTKRYAATKMIEGDGPVQRTLALSAAEEDIIHHIVEAMEASMGTDREAALADMRYLFIEGICKRAVRKSGLNKEQHRSARIDNLLTHRIFAIPIFLLVMASVFFLTFGLVGAFLSDGFSFLVDTLTSLLDEGLAALEINSAIHSLIIDGVCAGVGSVLSFLPTIMVLFFFLSILEDSGYMARVAFVMDKLLRKIGLSGRSFVPMLVGFGCSVPAVMATRTLASKRDRYMTILLIPFMSCSAKLPIYATFVAAFFPRNGALVMTGLYLLGMLVAICYGLILSKTGYRGNSVPFVMELPAYRLPSLKTVILHMWEKAKDFLLRAFTIIFLASVLIWLLQSFDSRLMLVSSSASSLLASLGRLIAPIFAPLGFGDWISSTALVTGLIAKEAVVSTMAVLTGSGDGLTLSSALQQLYSPLQALTFLCFTLLYMPCVAAMAAIRRETGTRWAIMAMAAQTGIAWVVALIFRLACSIWF